MGPDLATHRADRALLRESHGRDAHIAADGRPATVRWDAGFDSSASELLLNAPACPLCQKSCDVFRCKSRKSFTLLQFADRNTAEAALGRESEKPGYSLALLHIVSSDSYPDAVRLSSALAFKNFLRPNWADEFGNYRLPENEVAAIKSEIVGLMAAVPGKIRAQLGEAISIIADSDFWERWSTLMDDLVSRLTREDAAVNSGVLQVAHSIFRRWRPLFRSDALFTEINHVLSKFGAPFLELLANVDQAIIKH